jgi:hypothetical protein
MQAPFILWDNILAHGTLTASTSLSGYEVDNIADMRTHTFWSASGASTYTITVDLSSSTSLPANAVGLAAHNLHSIGSTLFVEYSSDGSSWVTSKSFSATADVPYITTYTEATAQYWRLRINCPATATPIIGVLSIGTALNFPRCPVVGTAPPSQGVKAVSNHSQSGILLGNVIKYHPEECRLNFSYIPATFMRTSSGDAAGYGEFWFGHGRYLRPFFLAFSLDTYPEYCRYMRLKDGASLNMPLYNSTLVESLNMDLISCLEATT